MSLIIENNNRHEHNGNGIAIDQNVSRGNYVDTHEGNAY
jgi:hypothetical protein